MEECPGCAQERENGATLCGFCRREIALSPPRAPHVGRIVGLVLLFIIACLGVWYVVFPILYSVSSVSARPNISNPVTGPRTPETAYIGMALGYLKSQNELGMRVAVAMARLNTGGTTLEQLQTVVKDVHFASISAFQDGYLSSGNAAPRAFAEIDKTIRRSHALRIAALDDYLGYWQDGDLTRIVRGSSTFKLSELVAQEATAGLKRAMTNPTP